MAVFKCKMCGGTLEIQPGESVAVCDSCGAKQTVPNISDDKRANLYDRADHFRRANEFDKARNIYEQILNDDNTDAEAHWASVLCKYGIEYVEDPQTHKRVPTVNRAQYTSVFADEDYKDAIKYADGYQRDIYEQEAKQIDEIQKGILAISQNEEPYDVFISFKETDANGRRTPDSVLANELYHQLTKEGFKVFFAPITLEDKLGTEYEPYIFAALNSAKVMVVLGTKPDYFNAPWVRNEWSRYLALIKNGAEKTLVPAFKDMDPYDLPEEFSHLMAQDMSKLGFMQDLIHGIKKIVSNDAKKIPEKDASSGGNPTAANIAPLLKRAYMFLEDGEFEKADDFCEQVLNMNPECAGAYLGKLMADLKVSTKDELRNCAKPFDNNGNYQKYIRFASEEEKKELREISEQIKFQNEQVRQNSIYQDAIQKMNTAAAEDNFKKAKESYVQAGKMFKQICGWKDADIQIEKCRIAISQIWKKEQAEQAESERKAEEKRIADELASKKRKKRIAIAVPVIVSAVALFFLVTKVIVPNSKYNAAVELYQTGKYDEAVEAFTALDGYKDSQNQIKAICHEPEYIKTAKPGNILYFGSYEQDNNASNGKEEIEWQILAKEDNRVLVISKYALDSKLFNTSEDEVTWGNCSLRKWLNGDFINEAFSTEEQTMIKNTSVSADKNPNHNTNPGDTMNDKVFLLSILDVEKYFSSDYDRQCKPTEYAKANGGKDSIYGNCWWWLRSPGVYQIAAAYVSTGGSVNTSGLRVNSSDGCVRPALWINLDS